MRRTIAWCLSVVLLVASGHGLAQMGAGKMTAATPTQLVASYESLADTLIAAKKTEWNLVHSILAMTYSHAEGVLEQARRKAQAGENAGKQVEMLAELVGQLATEGDARVAAIRKRLVDAGIHHHAHHAKADEEERFDPGFVIVDKAAKNVFLDAANRIAKLGPSPTAAALDAEWAKVRGEFQKLHKDVR